MRRRQVRSAEPDRPASAAASHYFHSPALARSITVPDAKSVASGTAHRGRNPKPLGAFDESLLAAFENRTDVVTDVRVFEASASP